MKKTLDQIRNDFPTFEAQKKAQIPFHYLDNAATTLKPQCVLDAMNAYYVEYPANIHRGSYDFSQRASLAYENAREDVAQFLGVSDPEEVIFTSGSTGSSNLFAHAFLSTLDAGDEILITTLEHNSNLVPWMKLCEKYGLVLRYLPFDMESGTFDLALLPSLLNSRTRLLSFTLVSNTLGVVTPFLEMIRLCKERHVRVCLDIAQAVSHMPIFLKEWGVDAAFFSGHKVFGPTGIGALYVEKTLLQKLPPVLFGGGIVSSVSRTSVDFSPPPELFEPGTPPIAQAIGLSAALRYVQDLGWETILSLEKTLSQQFRSLFSTEPGLSLYAIDGPHVPVFSFNVQGIHPHDVGTILDSYHVAVRTGQHCTHLLLQESGVLSTVRASLAFYNSEDDLLALREGLRSAQEIFHVA